MLNLKEAAQVAMRLVHEGMALKHAIQLVSSTYGYEPDQLYRKIAILEKETNNNRK